ncbi:MAG: hypothetical protein ABGY41_10265, partial [Candidatus Poribacteria bacterium]
MSTLFVVLFALVVAPPMARNAVGPRTPANPTTPRPLQAATGILVFPGAEGFGRVVIVAGNQHDGDAGDAALPRAGQRPGVLPLDHAEHEVEPP